MGIANLIPGVSGGTIEDPEG
ncbi:hypothetical protein LCGC14_3150130, partial [marine sediment metagenome]